MLETGLRRALIAGAACVVVAGCSNAGSLAPTQSSGLTPSVGQGQGAVRVLPGPVVAGPIIVPLVPHLSNLPHIWPDRKAQRQILFVADGSQVLLYNPKKANSSPVSSITTGINAAAGLAVDKHSALYVANGGNSTVTVYPKGKTAPSLTISSGLSSPYGITVDSKGDVFVSNLGSNAITAYKAGATSPYETISFNAFGQAVGVGSDAKDNIWVACDSSNAVYEIPAGSSTPKNANLGSLNGPIGVSFGKSDVIYVSNFATSDVNIYTYGSTTPSATITNGIEKYGPTLNGFTASGAFFQSNQDSNVVGYQKGQTSPFSTLTGATTPLGIASSPLIKK